MDRPLALRELPPEHPYAGTPAASASSAAPAADPALVLDGDPATAWRSAPGDAAPWLAIDFGEEREYGGLVVDWAGGAFAAAYDVEVSDDGADRRAVRMVMAGDGDRDYLALPESESRWIRLHLHPPAGGGGADGRDGRFRQGGFAVGEVRVEPLAFGESANSLFQAIAADARRGDYPRYFAGE